MRTLIIGLGRMGERHLQNAIELGLKIEALFDVNLSRLKEIKARYNLDENVKLLHTPLQLESLTEIDFVVIATNADLHLKYVKICSNIDGLKKILCEKPLATSVVDCNKISAICHEKNIDIAVNHQMRFMEQYTLPKKLIESEELGPLVSVTVNAGNFGLAMNGTHYFEAFKFINSCDIASVSAHLDEELVPNPRGSQYSDAAGLITIFNENGVALNLNSRAGQGHGLIAIYFCRNGFIIVDELAGNLSYQYRDEEFRSLPTTRYGCSYKEKSIKIKPADALLPSRNVMETLLSGGDYPTDIDGTSAVKTLIAAHHSSTLQGKLVVLNEIDIYKTLPIA